MTENKQQLEHEIAATHKKGVGLWAKIRGLIKQERTLEAQNKRRRKELGKLSTGQITMYDSVTVAEIPAKAAAVAGYVGGKFSTFVQLLHDFPHALKLSIAVNSSENAECLDVETGDATPEEAPAWIKRQKALGVRRPCVYANESTMPAVKSAIISAGIDRSEIRLWVAHYDGDATVPSGYDAKQYSDKALGRNLDVSVCRPNFFD